MRLVYLDNAATTQVCRAAADKALEMMTVNYGNPSSLHRMGASAEQAMETARKQVSKLLGCSPETLFFTSGGTESNNLAVFGAALAKQRAGRHIVTTAVEHSSVLESVNELERQGCEVTRLVPDKNGVIEPEHVAEACRSDTVLVSIMYVNNEIGIHFPIDRIVSSVRRVASGTLIHCDAVQAAGKMPLSAERIDIDLMSASAHKLHGPKGCGALYIKKGTRILPRVFGGGHERGIRAGTEPVPLVSAFGVAAEELPPVEEQNRLYHSLRQRLHEGVERLRGVVWISPKAAVPYIVNIAAPGIKSETMLHFLAQHDVYVSSGSACSKGKKSHVLTALGLPDSLVDSALRVSFSHTNTVEDIDRFLEVLEQGLKVLVRR